MEYRLADKAGRPMTEDELAFYLEQSNIMRIGIVDVRDGFPIVHPVWYYYESGRFFVATDMGGQKARALRMNPALYFLIDSDPVDGPPLGVRGKASTAVVDDPEYATRVTKRNIVRYLGSLEGKTAQKLLKMGSESCVIEITPRYIATWKF